MGLRYGLDRLTELGLKPQEISADWRWCERVPVWRQIVSDVSQLAAGQPGE